MFKFGGSIQGRIFTILAVVFAVVLVLAGVCTFGISNLRHTYSETSSNVNSAFADFMNVRVALEQTIITLDTATPLQRKSREQFQNLIGGMQKDFEGYEWSEGLADIQKRFTESERFPAEAARVQLSALRGRLENARALSMVESKNQLFGQTDTFNKLLWPLAFLALLLPAFSVWWGTRAINRDLSAYVTSLESFTDANDKTSEDLRDASQNLSSASSQQSAAVQETVASIAEIRSMLALTANHVREVQSLTTMVNDKTHEGSRTMTKMEAAMIAIEDANAQLQSFEEIIRSIREKTQVINDIVFKTQLLSFNASIEAARAGQYGRGFAVVAEEVGKLAHLSGGASRDIDQLLGDSQARVIQIVEAVRGRVVDGKQVSGEALKRFGEIANQIVTISEKINQVNEATLEQESGVEQTARVMDQMDTTAMESKKAADEILKIAGAVRHLSVQVRAVTMGIQAYVRDDDGQLVEPNSKVVDIVQRLSQKRPKTLKPTGSLPDFNADDPSFKKPGDNI